MRAKIVFPVLAAAIASFAEQASACPQVEPFHLEDVRRADLVFKGRLLGYTTPSRWRSNVDSYAILTVHVDETVRGNVRGNIRLYWGNSTFGVPKTMRIRRPMLIAAIAAHPTRLKLSSGRTLSYPTLRPDLLHVLEEPCSGPFMLPWTTDNVRDVEAVLHGETPKPRDYFAAFRDDAATRPTPYQLKEEAEAAAIGMIVMSLAIILAGIWQSKRRRQGV